MKHALGVLEFNRVREIVASHADSPEGRETILSSGLLNDAALIRARLAEVDEFIQAFRFDDAVPSMAVHDIREMFPLLGVAGYNLGVEHIAAAADNLEAARLAREYFGERHEKYPVLWRIAAEISPRKEIEDRVRKAITPDLEIADNASSELRSIRRKLVRARESLRNIVEKTLAGLSDDVVADRLVTIRNNRFVIPVRDSMKKRVAGAVHDRSQTGRTLFIEPLASIEGNNMVVELEMAEQAEIQRILLELSSLVSSAADDLKRNQSLLVRLDGIKARARYGVRVEGSIPVIADEYYIAIKRGRHPLLDWKLRNRDSEGGVVPLDLEIGDDFVTIVVTGPNAGGKTVALKTVGLLTAMALSAMPIPALEGSTLCVPAGIFADIGDEQSIDDDLSTFSSHMSQIVAMLNEARRGSLVLLDELGGGTNPTDGEAIALSVLKKLTGEGALSIVTTHHDALKVYAYEAENVSNASMEFDSDRLLPTFSFRAGVPGSSYAFEIAARMGMPASILDDAESIAGGERKTLEGLIAEMEEHMRRAEEDRKAALDEKMRLEKARRDYEARLADISSRRDEMLDEAAEESKRILADVNRRIETSIREIKETNASREAIVKAKSEAAVLKTDTKKRAERAAKRRKKDERAPVENVMVGQSVWVKSLGSVAEVMEVLDGGKKARVGMGRRKATVVVNTAELFTDDTPKQKTERKQKVRVNVSTEQAESTEIDLRGMTFDEAHVPLEQFLDTLHLSGIDFARVIHGKGSGALRKKVTAYLDSHPYVVSHRLGEWNEGSTGVTVVTLRKN